MRVNQVKPPTLRELAMFRFIKENPGLPANVIAKRSNTARGWCTTLLQRLEDRGMIRRVKHGNHTFTFAASHHLPEYDDEYAAVWDSRTLEHMVWLIGVEEVPIKGAVIRILLRKGVVHRTAPGRCALTRPLAAREAVERFQKECVAERTQSLSQPQR